jgi:hypothetical protein
VFQFRSFTYRNFSKMALAVLGALSVAHEATAQQCITAPVALPQLGGPPVWFDPAPSTATWRAELHDPRWAGAPALNLCDNPNLDLCGLGTVQAQVRVLLDGTDLYVSFENLVDDGQNSDDAVFIGIGSNGVLGARMAKVTVDTSASVISTTPPVTDPTPPAPNGAFTVGWAQASNANGAASWDATLTLGFPPAVAPATTSWLQKVATWRQAGTTWAITFKVDLAQFGYAIPITTNIPLFLGTRHTPAVGSAVPLPNVTADTVAAAESIVPGNKTNWTTYTPPAGPGGCSAGVTISSSNIGVLSGATLTGSVGICPGSTGCPGRTHTFRAQPQNVPDGKVVRTKMRLANFGSVPNDWPNADWEVIPGSGDPLVDSSAAAGWTFSAGSSGVATADFLCSIIGGAQYCPVLSNVPAQADQCLLVELGNPPSTNELKFQHKAVYRNLWFTNLSTVTKAARISIKGLQKTTGVPMDRDVYLYVQTANMPPHSDVPMTLPQRSMAVVRNYAEHRPPQPPYQEPKGGKNPKGDLTRKAGAPLPQNFAPVTHAALTQAGEIGAQQNPLSVPTLSDDQALGLVWPTYKVHVYYDSGRKVTMNGVERIVMVPMVPFGYYLNHLGTFYGFSHALSGLDGVELVPVAPNWYKVRIKNEGAIRVQTVITAEERMKSSSTPCPTCADPCKDCRVHHGGHCHCRFVGAGEPRGLDWALGGLAALAAVVVVRRRKRRDRV